MIEIDKPLLFTAAKVKLSDKKIERFKNMDCTGESYQKSNLTESIELRVFDGIKVMTKLYNGDDEVLSFYKIGELKLLNQLNRVEFEKTTNTIRSLFSQIHELKNTIFFKDSEKMYQLNEKIMYYQSFHQEFIVWFENNQFVAPQIPPSALRKTNIPNEFRTKDSKEKGNDSLERIRISKQDRVEILADRARADTENTPDYWWNIFKAEFQEKGYSTELYRYRNKFKKGNSRGKFRINGLTFYNKKNQNPK